MSKLSLISVPVTITRTWWTRKNCFRNLKLMSPINAKHPTYQISLTYLERQKCYGTEKKILFKKQLFDLEVKGQGHHGTWHHLMVMHPHTKYWPILKDKNVMAQTRKYYLKNNYLTLRSKVSQRSLRYATYRLMVMHPHTKYNWPIWKDKKVMVRTSFAEKKRKQKKKWKRKSD